MDNITNELIPSNPSESFRTILSKLVQNWYIILILTILGGASVFIYESLFPKQTIYKATAVLQNAYPDLSELMYDQDTLNSVAHLLKTSTDAIRSPSIYQRSDKSLFNITIQSTDPNVAIQQANAWADAINYQTHYYITDNANAAIKNVENQVQLADKDLVTYLYQQNLGSLTWSQLEEITGVIPNVNLTETQLSTTTDQVLVNNSISVTADQKLQIAKLVRLKVALENSYQSIVQKNNEILIGYKPKDFYVVSYARSVEIVSQQKKARDVTFGALLGLLVAIFGISLVEWWKETGK